MKREVLQFVSQSEDFFGKYSAGELEIKLVQCSNAKRFNLRFFPSSSPPLPPNPPCSYPTYIPLVTCSQSSEGFDPVFPHPLNIFLT